MSRLRKGGKYKGASFAEQFNLAKGNKSPLFFAAIADATKQAVENAKSIVEEKMEDPEIQAMADAAKDSGPEDIIPKKIGSSSRRSARSDFFTRSAEKQEEKDAQEEAERLAKEKEEAAIAAEAEREALSQGANIADAERGGKARRLAKRAAKGAAKEEKAAMKAQCKGLKGKAKRQCKKAANQNFRADKQAIRQANRAKKKENFNKTNVGKLLCTKRRRRKGKC